MKKTGVSLTKEGDCALLTPEDEKGLPYVGRIEHMYECSQLEYIVTCWFFHPEETRQGRRKTDSRLPTEQH